MPLFTKFCIKCCEYTGEQESQSWVVTNFFKQILIIDMIKNILCPQFSFEAVIQIFDANLLFHMSSFHKKQAQYLSYLEENVIFI